LHDHRDRFKEDIEVRKKGSSLDKRKASNKERRHKRENVGGKGGKQKLKENIDTGHYKCF
jgi:hypothetical protein